MPRSLETLFTSLVSEDRENLTVSHKENAEDLCIPIEKFLQFCVTKGILSAPPRLFREGIKIEPISKEQARELIRCISTNDSGCKESVLSFPKFKEAFSSLAESIIQYTDLAKESEKMKIVEAKISILLLCLIETRAPLSRNVSPPVLESFRFGRDCRRNSLESGQLRLSTAERRILDTCDSDAGTSAGSIPYWPGVVGAHSPSNRQSRPSNADWIDITDQAVLDTIRVVNPEDRDWQLSPASIVKFLQSEGLTEFTCDMLKPGVLDAMFAEADRDGDGFLNKREFKLACSVGRHRFRRHTELWLSLVRMACSRALARRHHSPEDVLQPKFQERQHAGPTRQAIFAQFERPGVELP